MSNRLRNPNTYIAPLAVTATALGAAACGADSLPGSDRKGDLNSTITSVTFDDNANVRQTPIVPGQYEPESSTLLTTLSKSVTIETPNGVPTFEDNNGIWYSVSSEELAKHVEDEDQKDAILEDEDGEVWVNDDRSRVTRAE